MIVLLYGALLLAQMGTMAKQFAMKRCGKLAPGPFNSVCINMLRVAICLVVSVVIWLFVDGTVASAEAHVAILLAGIGTAVNLFTWIMASRFVSLSLIESFMAIGTLIVPMFLAPVLYNGERITWVQWIGCALIFLSIFLFMEPEKREKKEGSLLMKVILVFGCVFSMCVATITRKYYTFYYVEKGLGTIEYYTMMSFVVVFAFFAVLFMAFYLSKKRQLKKAEGDGPKKVELPYPRVWKFVILAAVGLYLYELFFTYAAKLPSAIYYPLSRGLVFVGSFVLDVVVFRDKATLKKILGVVVVIAGSILVNL